MRVYRLGNEEKERIINSLREFPLEKDEVAFAYLHGSFPGDGHFRDTDVAVYVKSKVHPFYGEELSRAIGFPVDVRAPNDAPVTFRFRAMGGLLLFSRDEKARCDFEACIGIAYHPISRNRMRLPKDHVDSFRVRLVLMTRFRNRLVHIYWEVDDELIYEVPQNNLSDIEEKNLWT